MAKKPIDEEQRLRLRNKAKGELTRLLEALSDDDTREMVDDFKDRFAICEIVYKVILREHQLNKLGVKPDRMQVKMTQVPYALEFAGYDFDRDLLTKLFGSEEKVGRRSVKKLRDSLTHSMNQRAIEELSQRREELNGYMDVFLEKIDTFDDESQS